MSKPLNLDLLERVKKLEEIQETKVDKKWNEQDVNLSYNDSTTIEDIKNATEILLVFSISERNYIIMNFPRILSGSKISTTAKDGSRDLRCTAAVNFDTGTIQNGAEGYVDLRISKVFWR